MSTCCKDALSELRTAVLWRDVMCEVLAMSLLSFGFTILGAGFGPDPQMSWMRTGVTIGFLVFVLIEAFGHISSCHINPIVTASFAVLKKTSWVKAIFYTLAQCIGSIIGCAVVYGLTPSRYRSTLPYFFLHHEVTPLQGVCLEAILAMFLMFVILGSGDEIRDPVLPSLPSGLAAGCNIIFGGRYTGACFNPALSIGPAVMSGSWGHFWIYWVGPYFGSFVATGLYSAFIHIHKKSVEALANEDRENQEKCAQEEKSMLQKPDPGSDVETDPWEVRNRKDLRITVQ